MSPMSLEEAGGPASQGPRLVLWVSEVNGQRPSFALLGASSLLAGLRGERTSAAFPGGHVSYPTLSLGSRS